MPTPTTQPIAAIVEPLICGDIAGLKPGQIRYTLLLNDEGGIIDDLMVARPADPAAAGTLYIVVNAGTKDGDFDLHPRGRRRPRHADARRRRRPRRPAGSGGRFGHGRR